MAPQWDVAADNDLGNVQSRDRVFNARRRGVVVFVRLVGGHEVAHVAQHKELAWGRIVMSEGMTRESAQPMNSALGCWPWATRSSSCDSCFLK